VCHVLNTTFRWLYKVIENNVDSLYIKLKMHFKLPLKMGASCQFYVKINEAKWQFNQGVSYVRAIASQQRQQYVIYCTTTTTTTTTITETIIITIVSELCNIWRTMRICSSRTYFSVCLSLSAQCELRVARCKLSVDGSLVSAFAFGNRAGCKCFWHLTGNSTDS